MALLDRSAPRQFLETAFEPHDWVAVFLKSYQTGRVQQRVLRVTEACEPEFQAWLRAQNAAKWNVYVSVNALTPGVRLRRRSAVRAVRHVFLEADQDVDAVLARLAIRADVPPPSYVLHSSEGRLHLFWRARGFDPASVELLQKRLARELGTDPAATPASQTTRVPGFFNHKRARAYMVWAEFGDVARRFAPTDFPCVVPRLGSASLRTSCSPAHALTTITTVRSGASDRVGAEGDGDAVVERARRYLDRVPPAVAGEHGDVRTFRVCCRLVRGFALADDVAVALLGEWNQRCQPPWTERELVAKIAGAHRYGREPYGVLLVSANQMAHGCASDAQRRWRA